MLITVQGKQEAKACMDIREALFKDKYVTDPHCSPATYRHILVNAVDDTLLVALRGCQQVLQHEGN